MPMKNPRWINPAFRDAFTTTKLSSRSLAGLVGLSSSAFSSLMNEVVVNDTPPVRQRLSLVAEAIGFPKEHIFREDVA